jgi:pantothenate kinase
MDDCQLRVIEERNELEKKIRKLNIFIRGVEENTIVMREEDCEKLGTQLNAMERYNSILTERICNFEVYDETD